MEYGGIQGKCKDPPYQNSMQCMQQRSSSSAIRINLHKGNARESSKRHKLKKEKRHNAEEKTEGATKMQHAKVKMTTGHTKDNTEVQTIHEHGVVENIAKSKKIPKPIRPALAPFSVKAKSQIMEE